VENLETKLYGRGVMIGNRVPFFDERLKELEREIFGEEDRKARASHKIDATHYSIPYITCTLSDMSAISHNRSHFNNE
jgi:CRISPR/Cas system CMR-associated protein Cmr1 (group 7 of RAMP superfamily)